MLLSKTCFPGIIQVFMYILVKGSILMIKLVLEIWPSTLSVRGQRCASLRASQERMIYVPAKKSTDGIAKVIYA